MQEFLGLPIEDWFAYHPPTTEARKALHQQVNQAALNAAQGMGNPDTLSQNMEVLHDIVKNSVPGLESWFIGLRDQLYHVEQSPFQKMMLIQQCRMVANQAVTVADLLSDRALS